jgi:ribose transport system substrate-binding protein
MRTHNNRYMLETVARACEVLRCFENESEYLKLRDIVRKTKLNKTIVFRILHTLTNHGLLAQDQGLGYRSLVQIANRPTARIGYAAQGDATSFSAAVTAGIRLAAARYNVDLVELDNSFSAAAALRNARRLVASGVDIVLDFQSYTSAAAAVSNVFSEANIPMIAIEVPHPQAIYYGADNYRTGLLAGRALGRWAKRSSWEVQRVLLLEAGAAGPLPRLRLEGACASLRDTLPSLTSSAFIAFETGWDFSQSLDATRRYLRRAPLRPTLITGINDMMVLGALRAFEEAGRCHQCAAVSLGAIPEARAELSRKGTRLIGSVAFFPERYGMDVVRTALDVLHHRDVPPAIFAEFEYLSPENLRKLYPVDGAALASSRLD